MRRITANRARLNIRQQHITVAPDGFVYVSGLKICQFDAAAGTLRFVAQRRDRNAGQERMVEVELLDFVRGLVDRQPG